MKARLATIMGMGRKDKGREICINCGQTFHKKLTSKELRCTKCRKAHATAQREQNDKRAARLNGAA